MEEPPSTRQKLDAAELGNEDEDENVMILDCAS
jgi:hypothetical protein